MEDMAARGGHGYAAGAAARGAVGAAGPLSVTATRNLPRQSARLTGRRRGAGHRPAGERGSLKRARDGGGLGPRHRLSECTSLYRIGRVPGRAASPRARHHSGADARDPGSVGGLVPGRRLAPGRELGCLAPETAVPGPEADPEHRHQQQVEEEGGGHHDQHLPLPPRQARRSPPAPPATSSHRISPLLTALASRASVMNPWRMASLPR